MGSNAQASNKTPTLRAAPRPPLAFISKESISGVGQSLVANKDKKNARKSRDQD